MIRFRLKFLVVILLISLGSNSFGQTGEEAISYMNNLFEPLQETKNETWQYLRAITRGKNARNVEKKRHNLLIEMKNVKNEVRNQSSFHGDNSLKIAIVDYLDMSYSVLNEDFDKILDMEDIAEQSYDDMEAYLLAKEKAGEKLDTVFNTVKRAEKAYALKYDFSLINSKENKDKTSQKIKKAGDALKYYNQIYLIFFKSYKQEAYVMDAINRADINGLVQNMNSMIAFTNEGLNKLTDLGYYDGDVSLKMAAKKYLMFYKKEAETYFPVMESYLIKKDNMEQIQKTFEAKKKRDITQDDIDKYNNSIDEFNKIVNSSNKINDETNTKRSSMLKLWNSTVTKFFDAHS